jgi:aldose 1-epimerase
MNIDKKLFGTLATGEEADLFVLDNDNMIVCVTNYGGILASILLPSGRNYFDDICLGLSDLGGFTCSHPYFGAVIGRFANRIGGARFTLDGQVYELAKNDGANHLHGGLKAFDKVVWEAEPYVDKEGLNLELFYASPDGDEGYPGNLDVTIIYTLTSENELKISYFAETDKATPVNLTNHAYFNLKGEGRGLILDHELILHAPSYLVSGSDLIPTGEIAKVDGTPYDFRTKKAIGKDIAATGIGYDTCFILGNTDGSLVKAAEVIEPTTRRTMTVSTDMPGIQLYTGNYLEGVRGKRGSVYAKHSGFCLETQYYPDSPNKSAFPNCVLRPEADYARVTSFAFGL